MSNKNKYEVLINWFTTDEIDRNSQTIYINANSYYEASKILFKLYNFDSANDIRIRRIA